MKKILFACLMLVSSVAFAGKAEKVEVPKGDDAIKAVFAQVDAAFAKHDSKMLMDLFMADGTFIAPMGDGKVVKGKADMLKHHEMMMQGPMKDATAKHTVENIRWINKETVFADVSAVFTGMKMDGMPAGAPAPMMHAVAILMLKDGKWQLADVRPYSIMPAPVAPAAKM